MKTPRGRRVKDENTKEQPGKRARNAKMGQQIFSLSPLIQGGGWDLASSTPWSTTARANVPSELNGSLRP
jgi:hypothetical protein